METLDDANFKKLIAFVEEELTLKRKAVTNQKVNNINPPVFPKNRPRSSFLKKLENRQITGDFSGTLGVKYEAPFYSIPDRLKYCLRTEIIPRNFREPYYSNHIYMGLTACGQFLLSYTQQWVPIDVEPHNDFRSEKLEYKLYFWKFRTHYACSIVKTVILFDDNSGVYHNLNISMAQWKDLPYVVVVHGTSFNSGCIRTSLSYITWVAVPALGCVDCKQLATIPVPVKQCVRHNLLVHTKYDCNTFDVTFSPYVSMRCTGYVVINTGAFLHVLHADIDRCKNLPTDTSNQKRFDPESEAAGSSRGSSQDIQQNILSSDQESNGKESSEKSASLLSSEDSALEESDNEVAESSRLKMAEQAYEFVEDTENCEKISLFRKRRLADKKYEFREELHNEIPCNYLGQKFNKHRKLIDKSTNVLCESPPNYNKTSVRQPILRNNNPLPSHISFKGKTDKTIATKCAQLNLPRSPVMRKSFCLDDLNIELPEIIVNNPLFIRKTPPIILEENEGFKCSLKFSRYMVQEHERSCIVDTETAPDDLLPSGYHTALPLCAPSFSSITRAGCTRVNPQAFVISFTQQTFDIETFCYLVSTKLCESQKKTFKNVEDWFCEILKVSPITGVTGLMFIHLVAIPQVSTRTSGRLLKECQNCILGDCICHKRHYEAKCLFQWDMNSGDYNVILHTDLVEMKVQMGQEKPSLWKPTRLQMLNILNSIEQDALGCTMRIHRLHKTSSLQNILDWDNYIQINRNADGSESE